MTNIDRRSFVKKSVAATGAAVGATAISLPAFSKEKRELRMVTSWPKNFPGLGTAAARFAKRVEATTNGRITIKVFGGGELVGALKVHDAVQEGTADMYHSAEYYFQGKSKGLSFFGSVPMGLTADEINAWINHGGGQELWDNLAAEFNIKPLACGNPGAQMGGWFKEPITDLDGFKGLKMRMPGLGGDVLKELGATPITLPGSEILPALQAGTIDATEWVGPWHDLAFGLHKVTKNYHYPGFHEPGTVLALGINKKVWDSFSKTDQEILANCAAAENSYSLGEHISNNANALQQLVKDHGVKLHEYPDEVYKKVAEVTPDIISQVATSDPATKKVVDSYLNFRNKVLGWSVVSDAAYMKKRVV